MSSQKIPVAKLKLPLSKKPVPTAQIFCPSNTFSLETASDSRISTANPIDKTPKTRLPSAYINQFKDLLQIVSESAVEINPASELNGSNGSELSLLKMLGEENKKRFEESSCLDSVRDGSVERKLREEVTQLKRDLIMKSSLIEKLIKENDSLRKEMDEVLVTVEDAKSKIGIKLNECNQRIKELENEVKTLSEEKKQYQEQMQLQSQMQRAVSAKDLSLKPSTKKQDDQVGRFYSDAYERVEAFYHKLNEQFGGSVKSPRYQSTSSYIEDKENINVRSRHGSPSQVRPHLSPTKVRNVSQIRNVKPLKVANNSPVGLERVGAMNNSNRRNKTMALHHVQDAFVMNKSEGHCVRPFNPSDSYMANRSPKVGFTPQAKIKLLGADC